MQLKLSETASLILRIDDVIAVTNPKEVKAEKIAKQKERERKHLEKVSMGFGESVENQCELNWTTT